MYSLPVHSKMLRKTKKKLARWRCYRHGHHYTYEEIQSGVRAAFRGEDDEIECKRCSKRTHVEDSDHPKIAGARIARSVKEFCTP